MANVERFAAICRQDRQAATPIGVRQRLNHFDAAQPRAWLGKTELIARIIPIDRTSTEAVQHLGISQQKEYSVQSTQVARDLGSVEPVCKGRSEVELTADRNFAIAAGRLGL